MEFAMNFNPKIVDYLMENEPRDPILAEICRVIASTIYFEPTEGRWIIACPEEEDHRIEAIFNSIFVADRFLHPEAYDE